MERFECMIRVQWGIVQMAAISGAAEHVDRGDYDRYTSLAAGYVSQGLYLPEDLGEETLIREEESST